MNLCAEFATSRVKRLRAGRAMLFAALLLPAILLPAQTVPAPAAPPPVAATPVPARKPAVLLISFGVRGWDSTDFPCMQRFNREGFQMDYLESPGKYSWDLVKNYNVLVFTYLCRYNSANNLEELRQTLGPLERFLEAGGGVWILPNLDLWCEQIDFMRAMDKDFLPKYGVKYLFQQGIEDEGTVTAGIWPRNKYAYTRNYSDHPIAQGLKGIWYPLDPSGRAVPSTTPLEIDTAKGWQAVLSASPTARCVSPEKMGTKVKDAGMADELMAAQGPQSAPVLLAVRDFGTGKGRMAFMAMNSTFHLEGGSSIGLDGTTMEGKGINNVPSDLFKLFANTFRWLAEPSLKSGALGGYVQKPERLVEFKPNTYRVSAEELKFPAERQQTAEPTTADLDRQAKAEGTSVEDLLSRRRGELPAFKGLIGARSNLSTGKATPGELIAAARKAGLDYLVFLEDFTAMTPAKLDELKKECAAACSAEFQAIPGLHIDDNRGHSQHYFGNKVVWPEKAYLTADGKRFDVSARPNSSGLPQIQFMCAFAQGSCALGYFNFKPNLESAPMFDLRLYNSIGLVYSVDKQEQEGLDLNFKEYLELTDQGTNPMPLAIDIVTTPEALAAAVTDARFLTWAVADKLPNVMSALWYSYLAEPRVFISQGPVIKDWKCVNRDYCAVGENFITGNYRWRVRCHLASDAGLKEIRIWDGPRLWTRYLLNGEKEFLKIFELSHNQQKNLILEVTDVNGRKAISAEQFDRNQLNYHFWCSDRINGNLYHGPFNSILGTETGPWYPGKGIDTNGTIGVPFQFNHPLLDSEQGKEGDRWFNHRPYQTLVCEDARIFRSSCFKKYPESEKIWMVWGTYGPLVDTELMTFEQEALTYRVGYQHYPLPETPAAPGVAWVAPSLFTGRITFKKDVTVKELSLFGFGGPWDMARVPNNTVFLAAVGTREGIAVCAPYDNFDVSGPYTLEPNGFMAMFGSRPSGAGVIYNRGAPIDFQRWVHGTKLTADLTAKPAFRKGETYDYQWITLTGRAADRNSLQRYDEIRSYLGLNAAGKPGYALALKQGKLLSARGLLDLEAANGVVELSVPPPEKLKLHVILGLRLYGLNSNWSAGVFDRARNRYRPIGTHENIGYVRLNPETGESKDVFIGHPVVCSDPKMVITFTQLNDSPPAYYCSVQNPTDKAVSVMLAPRLPLPGLALPSSQINLPPGGEATAGAH